MRKVKHSTAGAGTILNSQTDIAQSVSQNYIVYLTQESNPRINNSKGF